MSSSRESAAAIAQIFSEAGFPEGAYVNLNATNEQCADIIADPRILEIVEEEESAVQEPGTAQLREVIERKIAIKAEVVAFDDLDQLGSMAEARAAGKVRQEGKDYVMADGDVVEFRFNV